MAKNLRDRGYGNSTEGYQPKPERFHARDKTVVPGTAEVRKGQQAAMAPVRDSGVKLPSVEQIRSAPDYTPQSYQTDKTPVNLHYTDPFDAMMHYNRVEVPYRKYKYQQFGEQGGDLSLDEIKQRMDALEQAITAAYDRQNAGRWQRRSLYSIGDQGQQEHPAQELADYNWNTHDFLDDWMPDLTDDPSALAMEQIEHAKAAATGKALTAQQRKRNMAASQAFDAQDTALKQGIAGDEASINQLYWEYNDLKNQYNAMLAQYLQGLR